MMNIHKMLKVTIGFIFIFIIFAYFIIDYLFNSCYVIAPERISSIPPEAVWAGGPDGGSWFLCKKESGRDDLYSCVIYNDFTGTVWSKGLYVLRRYEWNEAKKQAEYFPAEPVESLQYVFYGGSIIELRGSLALVPDGIIDYPVGKGYIKRQRYNLGKPIGEEYQISESELK